MESRAAYYRQWRRRAIERAREGGTVPHGTIYGYRSHGCRCALCAAEQRRSKVAYRAEVAARNEETGAS